MQGGNDSRQITVVVYGSRGPKDVMVQSKPSNLLLLNYEGTIMVTLQDEELLIEETEPNDDDEPQNIRYEITSFPTDFTVKVMYEKWQSGQLVIPDYQRRYVWNLPQASRLIESFLLGLPIPQVFLYREHSGPKLYVVDGHQRLATIAHFYSGRFSDDREFRLRGVSPIWTGMNYTELSNDDRLTLDDATLRSIVIRQIQPRQFKRLSNIREAKHWRYST